MFAEISGTDTCRAAGIWAFLVLVQTGLGFTLLARSLSAGRIISVCAGIFGVGVGWSPEILKIGNWDQILFLSFIPFVLVRIRYSMFQTSRKLGVLALGLCLAATAFAYPEGAAISGMIYLPMLVWRMLRVSNRRGKIRRLVGAIVVAFLVSGVYLPTFVRFLSGQIASATNDLNAKGSLAGLLSSRWLPAIYGLGEQSPISVSKTAELLVPLFFVGLSSLALITWWRRKDGILLTVPVFFLLTLWQAVLLRYDYGFYKGLTMFWPVMVVAIFVGISELLEWSSPGLAQSLVAAAFFGLLVKAVFDQSENFQYAPWRQERQIKPFLELTSLKTISGDAPICIVTQSWFNQMWALFFLQGHKLIVPNPMLKLSNSATGLKNVANEQLEGIFELSDEPMKAPIWHNEIFSLENHLEPVELWAIDAPNHVETVQTDSFIWLNNQFTDFTIHSDADREAILKIKECWPGPSRPGDAHRTLIIEVNGAKLEMPASPNLKVPLKLIEAKTLLGFLAKSLRRSIDFHQGMIRTLLLGIKGFSVTPAD